jgi:hypothetical protein
MPSVHRLGLGEAWEESERVHRLEVCWLCSYFDYVDCVHTSTESGRIMSIAHSITNIT